MDDLEGKSCFQDCHCRHQHPRLHGKRPQNQRIWMLRHRCSDRRWSRLHLADKWDFNWNVSRKICLIACQNMCWSRIYPRLHRNLQRDQNEQSIILWHSWGLCRFSRSNLHRHEHWPNHRLDWEWKLRKTRGKIQTKCKDFCLCFPKFGRETTLANQRRQRPSARCVAWGFLWHYPSLGWWG